jgi:hypothetical protein
MRPSPFVILASVAMAGCNSVAPAPGAPPPAPASIVVTPPGFKLPEGGGCAGEIARYRAIQDNDLAMGSVNQPVYNQIHEEIAAADKTCGAGDDSRARAMILSSRQRHGYPTQL